MKIMGFFDESKPKISKLEFEKARQNLSARGFTHEKLNRLESILGASMGGTTESQKGIDAGEFDRTISSLKAHPDAKLFTPHELEHIETELRKRL
jgi:hypothetical protein